MAPHLPKAKWAIVTLIAILALQYLAQAQAIPTHFTQVVDSQGVAPKMFLDAQNNPHIFYRHEIADISDHSSLYYAFWTGQNWNAQLVKEAADNILIVDTRGEPHIINLSGGKLKDYHLNWDDFNTTQIGLSAVADETMKLDSNGHLYQLYSNSSKTTDTYTSILSLATWTESGRIDEKIDEKTGTSPFGTLTPESLAIDSTGHLQVIYTENDAITGAGWRPTRNLKYATLAGQHWLIQTAAVNISTSNAQLGNIAMDTQGRPHLCYVYDNSTYLPGGYLIPRMVLEYLYWNGAGWVTQVVEANANDIAFMPPHVRVDPYGNPQIYYYRRDYQNENNSGLVMATLAWGAWEKQQIWQLPRNMYGSQYISNLQFDASGNLHFTHISAMGTYHSALRYGNLTYVSLEAAPSMQTVTPSIVIFTVVLTIAIALSVGYALKRKKANAKAKHPGGLVKYP